MIRIGGNMSDYATYSAAGRAVSSAEKQGGSVVNDAVLRDLGGFLELTGWQLIWGLNLGNGSLENVILEASAVNRVAKAHLFAFEIGNEPDLFANVHRHAEYAYEDYFREYCAYRDGLRKKIPNAPLAGPDVVGATDWVTKFAADEGKDVKSSPITTTAKAKTPPARQISCFTPTPNLLPCWQNSSQLRRLQEFLTESARQTRSSEAANPV